MSSIGLVMIIAWMVIVAGVRGAVQYRRTGTMPLRVSDPLGSAQWWSRAVSSLGFVLAIVGAVARAAGWPAIEVLDQPPVVVLGLVLFGAGIAVTLVAQSAMGDAWRGDVDAEARSELVTTGPFRVVRNPIFTGTAITAVGVVLVIANALALVALACFVVSMQIQVRGVEEPYLMRVHGDDYRRYAARTGRFLPGIGRLQSGP